MTITQKDLQSLQKEIKALEKKIDKLIAAAGKSEKPKVARKSTAKPVKAKTIKKAPSKKAPAKKEIRSNDGNRPSIRNHRKIQERD
jgi:hypothetical protein